MVHLDDVLTNNGIQVAVFKTWQQVILEQTDVCVPAALIGFDVGQILVGYELTKCGHLTQHSFFIARVLPHGDLVAGLVGKCPSLRQ